MTEQSELVSQWTNKSGSGCPNYSGRRVRKHLSSSGASGTCSPSGFTSDFISVLVVLRGNSSLWLVTCWVTDHVIIHHLIVSFHSSFLFNCCLPSSSFKPHPPQECQLQLLRPCITRPLPLSTNKPLPLSIINRHLLYKSKPRLLL